MDSQIEAFLAISGDFLDRKFSLLFGVHNRSMEKRMKIGVMGAQGSFSEQAGRVFAKKFLKKKQCEIMYLITADATLAALDAGEIDTAILAIENSTMGVVESSIRAMAQHVFSIQKIFSIAVPHCLLVKRGVTRREIKTIVSQDPAIQQCKKYLTKKWPKMKLRRYEDTAKAAHDLAQGTLAASCAVIASKSAARAYGLKVLEKSIQDLKSNKTTFIAAIKP